MISQASVESIRIDFAQGLVVLMGRYDLDLNDIATMADVTTQTVSNWRTGRVKNIGLHKITQIVNGVSKRKNINPSDILSELLVIANGY